VPSGQPDGFTILTAPHPSTTDGSVSQVIDRVIQFSRQHACEAKALCGATRVP
jgi:hypothetical protein